MRASVWVTDGACVGAQRVSAVYSMYVASASAAAAAVVVVVVLVAEQQ